MASAYVSKPQTLVRETGNMFAVSLEGLRRTYAIKDWFKEYIDRCWFIAKVTSVVAWSAQRLNQGPALTNQTETITFRQLGPDWRPVHPELLSR